MVSWQEFAGIAPDMATRAQARFDAYRHKVVATLRKDGSPRISGVEASFKNGELWLGMMEGSLKALDLRRDPRLALHSATEDPPDQPDDMPGAVVDVKASGRAIEVTDREAIGAYAPPTDDGATPFFHLFKVDLTEVVLVSLGDPPDHLVIETWRAGKGVRRIERR